MNAKPVTKPENDIIDLDLSQTARKTIRFDGDNNRIVRINTSDMGIVKRFEEAVKELQDLQGESVKILENSVNDEEKDDMTALTEFGTALADIDQKMRDLIDKIFDAPVSAAAAPDAVVRSGPTALLPPQASAATPPDPEPQSPPHWTAWTHGHRPHNPQS